MKVATFLSVMALAITTPPALSAPTRHDNISPLPHHSNHTSILDGGQHLTTVYPRADYSSHYREEQFVQDTLGNLSNLLPDKNILIFHDQKSQASLFGNPYHEHFELDIKNAGRKSTKGYEIWVFDGQGLFWLHGDGGWRNWGVTGCYNRTQEKVVQFFEVRRHCPELYEQRHYVYTQEIFNPSLDHLNP